MVQWHTYPVREHAVADLHRNARSVCDAVPPVRFLRDSTLDIMVPVERRERAQLHPAIAQLLVRVAVEPTRIRANHRNLEELELEHTLDVVV